MQCQVAIQINANLVVDARLQVCSIQLSSPLESASEQARGPWRLETTRNDSKRLRAPPEAVRGAAAVLISEHRCVDEHRTKMNKMDKSPQNLFEMCAQICQNVPYLQVLFAALEAFTLQFSAR